MRWWILACLIGCGSGLQSTSAECKDGYERGDDGSCYATDGAESDDDGSPTGGDAGDVDEGPPDDDGPSDDGPGDEGPGDDAPPDDDDFDDSCDSPEDCTSEKCPEGSMGCTCFTEAGICVPTCNTDADCPDLEDVDFECTDDGICDIPIT